MKRSLIIGGSALGAVLVAALVVFVFVPGLPTYFQVKHKYEHINDTVPEFVKSEVPDSFSSHSVKGIGFKVPEDWSEYSSIPGVMPSSYHSPDEKSSIMVIKYDSAEYDLLYSGENAVSDPWESYDYSEEDYRHFFKKIGADFPDKWLNLWMVWLIRDSFTAKDCIKLRGRDLKIFKELASAKDEGYGAENSFKADGYGYTAYIGQVLSYGYSGKLWSFVLVPEANTSVHYCVMLKCADEALARQILSTIYLK